MSRSSPSTRSSEKRGSNAIALSQETVPSTSGSNKSGRSLRLATRTSRNARCGFKPRHDASMRPIVTGAFTAREAICSMRSLISSTRGIAT